VGAFIVVRITINKSFNKGGDLNKKGKRSSAGGDSISIKLCRY